MKYLLISKNELFRSLNKIILNLKLDHIKNPMKDRRDCRDNFYWFSPGILYSKALFRFLFFKCLFFFFTKQVIFS